MVHITTRTAPEKHLCQIKLKFKDDDLAKVATYFQPICRHSSCNNHLIMNTSANELPFGVTLHYSGII